MSKTRSAGSLLFDLMNSIPRNYDSYQSNPSIESKAKLIEQCKQAVSLMNSTSNNFDLFIEMSLPQQILTSFGVNSPSKPGFFKSSADVQNDLDKQEPKTPAKTL